VSVSKGRRQRETRLTVLQCRNAGENHHHHGPLAMSLVGAGQASSKICSANPSSPCSATLSLPFHPFAIFCTVFSAPRGYAPYCSEIGMHVWILAPSLWSFYCRKPSFFRPVRQGGGHTAQPAGSRAFRRIGLAIHQWWKNQSKT
jgi:hypothetical protein